MLIFAIFLSFLICVESQDDPGVDLVTCKVNNSAGKKRPEPPATSCTDADPALCAALLSPALVAAELAKHFDAGEDFKVHTDCYKPSLKNLIEANCRSSCAMCCKAPEFDCANTGAKADCLIFSQNKALCTSTIASNFAKTKCPKTCGLCANRFPCANKIDNCELLKVKNLLNCTSPIVKEGCMGSCGINTCLTTPAPAPAITPKPACSDEANDCYRVKALNYCSKANIYGNAITTRCRQTCGFCH